MDSSFLASLQKLELMAFFSGYPIIFTVTFFITGNFSLRTNFKNNIVSLLPVSYALVGTLFLGLQLKKLFPDYAIENIKLTIEQPALVIWALLSILFWIPALAKKPALSLIHGLVFFFLLASDLFLQITTSSRDNDVVKNDMKVYAFSFVLNLCSLLLLALLFSILTHYKKRRQSL